jgi:uncharacterized protein (DUF1697 family)
VVRENFKKLITYVAFLRGINVGGNKPVKMDILKKFLEQSGFLNVKTLLASGNVVFESGETDVEKLVSEMEALLHNKFGFEIPVILRTTKEIQKIVDSDLFKKIQVTPETRLYITFLSEWPKSELTIPYESSDKNFKILEVVGREVVSVLTVTRDRGTIDGMNILEKMFGRKITTRNWNTVLKILK